MSNANEPAYPASVIEESAAKLIGCGCYAKLGEQLAGIKHLVGELSDEEVVRFLCIAFRHVRIVGTVEFNDIRIGLKMVYAERRDALNAKLSEPTT